MLFNSITFIIYLPIVFLLYWSISKQRKWQNLLVVIASYIFYGWWDWRFLFLIAFTSICSYTSGILLEKLEAKRKSQQLVSGINITINLLILGIFKYYNFFTDNIATLVKSFGYELDWVTLDIILPVGISFYTFQALSYTIDVYQHKIKATHDVVEFFAYISFFPQLVAGPIERATNLLPQFQQNRSFDYAKAVDGLRQMLWGFFKKMVIADNCAMVANNIWANYDNQSGTILIIGGILFTFQIYGDFSGYSDIAIGTARLFGFNLMRNFNFPYFSRSIPEFWRRWHISLTTWFRDYIYFPLGGSRCSKWKIVRNTMVVWAISGLWHGANWTFVCWGVYHAVLISLFVVLGINTKKKEIVAAGKYLPSVKEFMQIIYTFALVVTGWIIFRAESMTQFVDYMQRMFSHPFDGMGGIANLRYPFHFITIMLLVEWLQRDKQHALQINTVQGVLRFRAIRWGIYMAILMFILVFKGVQAQFIYFQF